MKTIIGLDLLCTACWRWVTGRTKSGRCPTCPASVLLGVNSHQRREIERSMEIEEAPA